MGKIKNVNLASILAIVLVAFVSIGYVYVNNGITTVNAGIKKSWNVSFNTDSYTSNGAGVDIEKPIITNNSVKMNVGFINPGDYKTYVFEVLNTGDINAILNKVNIKANDKNSKDIDISYVIYKNDNIITSSTSTNFDSQYNHLYRTYGTNTVEVTIMYHTYEGQVVPGVSSASYELNLSYVHAD